MIPGTHRLMAVGARFVRGRFRDAHPHAGDDVERLIVVRVPTPSPGRWSEYNDVVAAGTALWAVGATQRKGSSAHVLASRWTRRGWSLRFGPRGQAEAVDGLSPDVIYAVGSTPRAGGSSRGMFAHWTGEAWTAAARFDRIQVLRDVVVPAHGTVWAVGSSYVRRKAQERPFIVRRSTGGWHLDRAPAKEGFFSTIGGTPHNLWTFLSYPPVEGAELWRFTSYHRC